MKANVKTKQWQLSNKYSNHVAYLHLKPVSHSVAASIKDTALPRSFLTKQEEQDNCYSSST